MDNPIAEFKAWYRKLPSFSRTFISATFIITVLYSFGVISNYSLYYDPALSFKKLQLWRTITSFLFFGKFSFNYLISVYFAYFAISRVETQLFNRSNYADLLWLVVYLWASVLLAASIFGLPFTGQSFVFAFLYIWCKRKPFDTITFFFGLQVKSGYFPLVFMGFNVLMGQSLIIFLIGLFFGHLYIHIKDVLTVKYRKDYLPTPTFFSNFVKKYITKEIRGPNARMGGAQRQQPQQQRFFGGQGVRIG